MQRWRMALCSVLALAACGLTGCEAAAAHGTLTAMPARVDRVAANAGGANAGGANAAAPGDPAPKVAYTSPAPPSLPTGSQLAALRGKTIDGKRFDPNTLAGHPVVVWFWAPWCEICRLFAPDVNTTARRYAGRVTFIGVGGLDPSPAALRGFVRETGVTGVTHLADNSGALYRRFGVTAQNTWVIMRADGTMAYKDIVDVRDMTTELDKIVG